MIYINSPLLPALSSLLLSLPFPPILSLPSLSQAIDGFLLILDKDANILYVSETIAGYVGLIQVHFIYMYM